MKARRSSIAVGVLLIAILACNVPVNQSPLQPPDLVGTVTAQAMMIVRSSSTPVLTPAPASASSPVSTTTKTAQPTASPPAVNVILPDASRPSTTAEASAASTASTASTASPALPAAPTGLRLVFQCRMSMECFPHNDVHVDLSWQDNAMDEDGYYVYRDDRLLVTLGRDKTSYSDDTTMVATIVPNSGIPHITYTVQAFNAAGKSRKLTKSISCFG